MLNYKVLPKIFIWYVLHRKIILWLHKGFNPIVFVFNNHGNSSITLFVLCWVICSHSLHTFYFEIGVLLMIIKLTSASNSFPVYSNAFLFDEINHLKNKWPLTSTTCSPSRYTFFNESMAGERGIFQFSLVLTTATQRLHSHPPWKCRGVDSILNPGGWQ